MEKSYVTMEQQMCKVCGKEYDTGNILMDEKCRDRFETKTTTGYGLCDEHKKKFDEGYIAIVICDDKLSKVNKDDATLKPEDAYRTGEIIHIKREVFNKMFDTRVSDNMPMAFGDKKLAIKLKSMVE